MKSTLFRVTVLYSRIPELIGLPRVVSGAPLLVGRAEHVALSLPDPAASKTHAAIYTEEAELHIRDIESRNGTFVNSIRISESRLVDMDVIRIGDHLLLIQALAPDDVRRIAEPPPKMGTFLGNGLRARALREASVLAALGTAPVLVRGESGSGKELVASDIHTLSSRRGGPFVPVNCAAISEQLAESELFGHARGAYTGATERRDGVFGAAHGGTLFLDEIAETSPGTQARLLRAIESNEIRPVGETRAKSVDVRIVTATHVDLDEAVSDGRFRGDLLARLLSHELVVPPLRERREDILPLAAAYWDHEKPKCLGSNSRIAQLIDPDAAECLLVHRWAYNVRELVQTMRAARVNHQSLCLAALPSRVAESVPARLPAMSSIPAPPSGTSILEVAPECVPAASELQAVLDYFGGSVRRAAGFFGKDPKQIHRWAVRYGIDLRGRE